MELNKIDRLMAFRFLGQRGKTLPENLERIADECEERLMKSAAPKYVYAVYDIERTDAGLSVAGTTLVLKGGSIAAHLEGCGKCVLFAATLGTGVDALIREYEAGTLERALITDGLASAAVEQVCDRAEKEIHERTGGSFTRRFSPGYGDLPLQTQRTLLTVLDAGRRIGLTVTDGMIMLPRKSVTAIIGIKDE